MGSKRPEYGDGASPGKIFIGGLAKDTTIDTFVKHFAEYGDLTDSVIMKDRLTGRPRGFGFVTYADPSVVDTVISEIHVINGKQVEIKRTIPKGSGDSKDFKTKKVFVGGIPASVTEEELKGFFSNYGKVVEHEIIRDHATKRSRGFGFVVFDNEQVVDTILVDGKLIDMNGTKVEIKKAEPKKSSNPGPMSYGYGGEPRERGYRDGYGDSYGDGGRGGGYGPPYRSLGGLSSRYADYSGYGPGGPSGGEFGSRYSDFGGEYGGGGYRGGEPPLGGYSSRYSSFGGGGYGGGVGGYGRGGVGKYGGGYGGPGSGGYEPGAGPGYGGAAGPYGGGRGGYGVGGGGYGVGGGVGGGGGSGRYHPYGR